MIPRYQIVLFAILLAAAAAMGFELLHLRQRAHQRLLSGEVTTPTRAPDVAPAIQATLMVANDADGSLTAQNLSLPLPTNPNQRARAILGKLLDIYATPGATHQIPGGAASVLQVFLMPATGASAPADQESAHTSSRSPASATRPSKSGAEIAVVNLAGAFANNHPSGLQTESLTLLSICDTLHANIPRISAVRFLVDGHPRATLSGHADLTRTYLPAEPAPPVAIQSHPPQP